MLDRDFGLRAGGIPMVSEALVNRGTRTANWLLAKSLIVEISSTDHRASFRFKAIGAATGFQCALIKLAKHYNNPSPRFRSCRSPKLYSSLKSGRYQFLVRAFNTAAVGRPAKKTFTIR